MRTISYRLEDLKKVTIHIGYVGENEHTRVNIDAGEVFAENPDAVVTMKVQPPRGEVYPVTVSREGDIVTWEVKDSDLVSRGAGEIQLTFTEGTEVIKSCIARISIDRSIVGNGTAPDPVQDWVDSANEKLAAVEEATTDAETAAGKIDNMTVAASGSAYGSDPTATITEVEGHKHVAFTIPAGQPGTPGDPTQLIDDTAGSGTTGKTWSADKINTEVSQVKTDITELETGKISEPSAEGTSGQVLTTNGNGGRVWTTPTGSGVTVDTTLSVSGAASDSKIVGDITGDITKRQQDNDGFVYLAPSNFEIGNLSYSSSGWSYPAGNTTRVRSKQGVSYHLKVGDVISLSSYTNAQLYVSWLNTNNVYKNSGWKTANYTVSEEGEYVLLLANLTEVTQTSIDALFNLLSIRKKDYETNRLEAEIEKRDKKILISMYGTAEMPLDTNQIYNGTSHTFTSNPNRISFAEPYQFNTGDKINVDVATGEKFYLMYFNRVNNTGTINTDFAEISGSATGWKTADTEYVSDGDKYVFIMVAFSGDTAITSKTVKTKITITQASLPDYWKSYLTTKVGDINTAMDAVGGIGDAFVFYTDPHWGSKNQKHTPQIIDYLLKNTSLREVYCGGDVIDSGSGGFTGYCRSFRDITVFTCRGNHDQNPNASSATDIVPDTEFYNRILKPIEHQVETNGNLYFYRDNPSAKIRYIFMDSGSARADTLDTAQLTWMQNALTSLESGWSALVIQHIVWDGAYASSATLSLATQGTKTINAINDVWSQMNCQFIGIISGHVHRDYSITETTHGYPIIATSCDVGSTGRTDYDPDNAATVGTTNEQLFDVFIINKSTRSITVKRIGAGSDRSFTYPAMS